jgi:dsDNA-binding SOS-regulon protein
MSSAPVVGRGLRCGSKQKRHGPEITDERRYHKMTVEVRYLVIRDGKEVAMYLTKKEADEHDKMLDIALALTGFIGKAEKINIDEDTLEELTIYLSQNRDDVMRILKALKPRTPPAPEKTEKLIDIKGKGKKAAGAK